MFASILVLLNFSTFGRHETTNRITSLVDILNTKLFNSNQNLFSIH